MRINGAALFQTFKYIVYVLLAMNIYWFYSEESAAAVVQFAKGVALSDLIEAYSATIDTAAWVVLLLMFDAPGRLVAARTARGLLRGNHLCVLRLRSQPDDAE